MAMKLKDVYATTVEDIRNAKNMNMDKLLTIVRDTVKLAKNRRTWLNKNLEEKGVIIQPNILRNKKIVKKGAKITPTVLHDRPNKKMKKVEGQQYMDFDINYDKVRARGGYAYLLSVYARAREFITAKTSTIEGFEQSLKQFRNTLEQNGSIDWGNFFTSPRAYKQVFAVYDYLRKEVPAWNDFTLKSTEALKEIIEYKSQNKKMGLEDLKKNLKEMSPKYYTKQQQQINTRLIESGIDSSIEITDDF